MKKLLSLLSIAFPFYLNAMDLEPENIPLQIISNLKQLNEEQLTHLSNTLCNNFQTLEKAEIISLPFTSDQANILNYSSSKAEDLVTIVWEISIPSSNTPSKISFQYLLKFYADLQSIKPPKDSMSFSMIKSPSPQEWLPFIQAMTPYALAFSDRKVVSKDPLYTKKLMDNPSRVKKISSHGRAFQRSLSCLPKITLWNWLEMRYHLHELSNGFGFKSNKQPQNAHLDPSTYLELFSGSGTDLQDFVLSIKGLAFTLQKELGIPLDENPSQTVLYSHKSSVVTKGAPHRNHREKLKVLFDQLPHITLWEKLKKDQEKKESLYKIMDFWKLYIDLSKNYHIQKKNHKKSIKEPYQQKLMILCQKVFPSSLQLNEGNVSKILDHKSLKGMLHSFADPFNPHLHEILGFQYHVSQLFKALANTKKPLKIDVDLDISSSSGGKGFFSFFG